MHSLEHKPAISVVMSAYNSGQYLQEAIDSILGQSFGDFEFIIFDDGSTDNTKSIIEKCASMDKRIIAVFNQENIGAVGFIRNLNNGIQMARGTFVARMDSDDISMPHRFEVQIRYLEANPDVFLCSSGYELINEQGEFLSEEQGVYSCDEVKNILPRKNIIHHPTVMFRNERPITYREKALYCEDYDLWLRFLSSGKQMSVLPDILLKYRVHPKSETNSNAVKQRRFIERVTEWYRERIKTGADTYDSFDEQEILSVTEPISSGEVLVSTREIKYLFKSNQMEKFQQEIREFWIKNGYFIWWRGYIFYILSICPRPIQKTILRIFWK